MEHIKLEQQHLDIPTGAVVTAMITIGVAVVGWFLKLAAREALETFKGTMAQHARAIEANTEAIQQARNALGELHARVAVLERESRWNENK
jgi:hypothetical protein